MLCGCGGNRRPGGKQWQPTAGWMTYGHLQAECLYTWISSGPNARYQVWEAFTFLFYDSDYLRYLRTKRTVADTLQVNHNCLLTVAWTVLLRRAADARAAASDTQHCWGRVCLPPRQCASTSRSRHMHSSFCAVS